MNDERSIIDAIMIVCVWIVDAMLIWLVDKLNWLVRYG